MTENNRILIVEDDSLIREIYQDSLLSPRKTNILSKGASLFGEDAPEAESGVEKPYELTLAERGEKGVQEVEEAVRRNCPFVAALIDMKMPGIDGAETAKRIWKIDPRIKIVIVTAFHEYTPDEIIRITGREDIFYLRKPFNPEEIRQFARVLTSQWALERENESLTAKLRKINKKLENLVKDRTAALILAHKKLKILNQEKMTFLRYLFHEINAMSDRFSDRGSADPGESGGESRPFMFCEECGIKKCCGFCQNKRRKICQMYEL